MVKGYQKSSLYVGNGALQTFTREGLHVHTKPVEEFLILEAISLAANTAKLFKLNELNLAFKPVSLFAKYTGNPSGTITINFLLNGVVINSLSIPATNAYAFPFFIVRPDYDLSIVSDKVVDRIIIFGEQVSVLDTITPQ